VKGKWILPIMCVLVMVGATSGVSAVSHDFGTATTLLQDASVTATAPVIDDWEYKLEVEQAAFLNVTVDCEFSDDAGMIDDFNFHFHLSIDVWTYQAPGPAEFFEHWGHDDWSVAEEDSTNWNNDPFVYTHTLDVEIAWISPPNPSGYHYVCTLDVYIEDVLADHIDSDQETWVITCDYN